jgi:uncharacterized protein (UPF0332 family)
MNDNPVKEMIQVRLRQAHESLKEAKALYQSGFWRGTINRAYYAMFYATLALTAFRQEVTHKHSGVISFFDREFVKTGLFDKEYSKSLHLAFQRRQENDYGDLLNTSSDEAQQAIKEAQDFITAVEEYLKST